jgi:hypothetical protein
MVIPVHPVPHPLEVQEGQQGETLFSVFLALEEVEEDVEQAVRVVGLHLRPPPPVGIVRKGLPEEVLVALATILSETHS